MADQDGLSGLLSPAQFTDPNIPEAHRVAVILQTERQLVGRHFVGRALVVFGGARQLHIVLHQNSIL